MWLALNWPHGEVKIYRKGYTLISQKYWSLSEAAASTIRSDFVSAGTQSGTLPGPDGRYSEVAVIVLNLSDRIKISRSYKFTLVLQISLFCFRFNSNSIHFVGLYKNIITTCLLIKIISKGIKSTHRNFRLYMFILYTKK